jgi:hypothetical protein
LNVEYEKIATFVVPNRYSAAPQSIKMGKDDPEPAEPRDLRLEAAGLIDRLVKVHMAEHGTDYVKAYHVVLADHPDLRAIYGAPCRSA